MTHQPAHLTDAELDDICRPLRQHAARIRYLRSLGLPVERRPDGSPLVRRADWDRRTGAQPAATVPGVAPRWSRAA